jgi:hypothetical protein
MSKTGNSNAVKHGLYAEMILLPGEYREEFKALYDALTEEWDPQGPTQEDKVLNLAQNMWRKRWSDMYRKQMILRRFDKEIDLLTKFVADVLAGKSLSQVRLPKEAFDHFKMHYPRKDSDSDAAWLAKLANAAVVAIEVLFEERYKFTEENIVDDRFCDEKAVVAELALQERIDAKIDKDIVSLGRMKTMQAMGLGRRRNGQTITDEPPKQVGSPPIQADEKQDKVEKEE